MCVVSPVAIAYPGKRCNFVPVWLRQRQFMYAHHAAMNRRDGTGVARVAAHGIRSPRR